MTTTTPTEHDKREWARMAADAYKSGRNGVGHRYSAAAALPAGATMPTPRYDALQVGYRSWLVRGWPCGKPECWTCS